jgi:hypothetical protein
MEAVTHSSVLLGRDTDVVEFCPVSPLQSLLAVGTYTLNQDTGVRDGCLHLLKVNPSSANEADPTRCATIQPPLPLPATPPGELSPFQLDFGPASSDGAFGPGDPACASMC